MYEHNTQIRVRYAETDRMDVVFYGNYPHLISDLLATFDPLNFELYVLELA
jgi:acyl-CoA thioesterase FadM